MTSLLEVKPQKGRAVLALAPNWSWTWYPRKTNSLPLLSTGRAVTLGRVLPVGGRVRKRRRTEGVVAGGSRCLVNSGPRMQTSSVGLRNLSSKSLGPQRSSYGTSIKAPLKMGKLDQFEIPES